MMTKSSLLLTGITSRLLIAAILSGLVWALLFWAMR